MAFPKANFVPTLSSFLLIFFSFLDTLEQWSISELSLSFSLLQIFNPCLCTQCINTTLESSSDKAFMNGWINETMKRETTSINKLISVFLIEWDVAEIGLYFYLFISMLAHFKRWLHKFGGNEIAIKNVNCVMHIFICHSCWINPCFEVPHSNLCVYVCVLIKLKNGTGHSDHNWQLEAQNKHSLEAIVIYGATY